MFKPSRNKCNTRSQIVLRKKNTGRQALSFFGLKIWTNISHSACKDYYFFDTCSEEKYFKQACG